MLNHWFQNNLLFYVCQSVSWFTSILKLEKYRDISRYRFLAYGYTNFKKFWISVSLLVALLPYRNETNIEISPVPDDISFWVFWRNFWDICTLFLHNFKFLVCLSVHYLAYFLTKIRLLKGYLQFWMRYLSEIFWRHSCDVGSFVPKSSEFLVCLLIC